MLHRLLHVSGAPTLPTAVLQVGGERSKAVRLRRSRSCMLRVLQLLRWLLHGAMSGRLPVEQGDTLGEVVHLLRQLLHL